MPYLKAQCAPHLQSTQVVVVELSNGEGPGIHCIPQILSICLQSRRASFGTCRFSEPGRSNPENAAYGMGGCLREQLQDSGHCVRSAPRGAPYLSQPHQSLPLLCASCPIQADSTSSIGSGELQAHVEYLEFSLMRALQALPSVDVSHRLSQRVGIQNSGSFHDP